MVKLIECPRDAMQGIKEFIPTEKKVRYLNSLLKVGFDTLDFGSFVSPTAVPQMADTAQVLEKLELSSTKLLAIIANTRGAEDACKYPQIKYLGFPLSVSETFQKRNTNKTIEEALTTVFQIQELCVRYNKEQVVYLSMGFGNPYGDPYSPQIIGEFVQKLVAKGIRIISLSDTIGVSDKQNIDYLFSTLVPAFPDVEFGAHLHSTPDTSVEKLEAAWKAGCKRFDSAMKGYGGCPMAKDDLVGNMATETLVGFLERKGEILNIDKNNFLTSLQIAAEVFPL